MTSTPEQVIAKIREALEAGPTPGPWEVYAEKVNDKHDALSEASYQIHYTEPFVGKMFMINAGGKCPAMTGCGPTSEVNADWLAACNPQNIAALLAERDALRKALEPFAAEAACYDPDTGDGDDSVWATPINFKIRDLRRARTLSGDKS